MIGPVRGRFAPSPTGPLHFGSLIAALGSFLNARHQGGQWLVRIDDSDRLRDRPGAGASILRSLERLGLHWDEPVLYQSERLGVYDEALRRLTERDLAFRCGCSRRDVAGHAYPGTCRAGVAPGKTARSVRLKVGAEPIRFADALQGPYCEDLARTVGDFVVHRADGMVAYHLATAIDDFDQGITEVVRGADLLAATARQIHIQRTLGLATPAYAHLPVVVDGRGQKLSKQTHAPEVDARRPEPLLLAALTALGQAPPRELGGARGEELLQWAIRSWRLARVPRMRRIPDPRPGCG